MSCYSRMVDVVLHRPTGLRYPKVNSFALNKLIQTATEVKDDWPRYSVRKFYAENIPTFPEARAALDRVDSDVSEVENINPSPQPVLQQPVLPQPVLPQPVLPQPALSRPPEQGLSGNGASPIPINSPNNLLDGNRSHSGTVRNVENFNTDGEAVTISSQCFRQLFKVTLQNQAQLKALNESRSQSQTDSASNSTTPAEEAVPILSACPLKSAKDFKKLEKALGEDSKVRKKLREELQLHMKKNPKESCRNLARCLISDELAQKFSWKGRPFKNQAAPKSAFEGTNISKQIYQSVNIKFPAEKMTVDIYQKNLENWFIQAKTRLQRSEERRAARAARQSASLLDLSESDDAEET